MQVRKSNRQRREETQRILIDAARKLFVDQGYSETATPQIVELAGVTRGALYHHFAEKRSLFRAVVEAEARAIADEIRIASQTDASPLDELRNGAAAWFEAMIDPARVRLMLIEGPAVLGPEQMREIDLLTGGRELRLGLAAALGDKVRPPVLDAIADLVSAMFDRSALARACGAPAQHYQHALDHLLARVIR